MKTHIFPPRTGNTHIVIRAASLLFFAFVFIVLPHSTVAQETASDEAVNKRIARSPSHPPVLNGHRFFSTLAIGNPFVATTVGINTGAGYVSNLAFNIDPIEGEQRREVNGDIAFINSSFSFQQAVSNTFAIRIGSGLLERLPTSEQSVLSQGVTVVLGYELGLRAKIWSNNQFYVSASGAFYRNTLIGITPLLFFQKIRDEGFDPNGDNSLLRTELSDRRAGSIGVAYSPVPFLGILVHSQVGSAIPFDKSDDNKVITTFGGSVSSDFGVLTRVPVGISLGFITESLSPVANDFAARTNTAIVGISYTGREDMDFGLEISTVKLKQSSEGASFAANMVRLRLDHWF